MKVNSRQGWLFALLALFLVVLIGATVLFERKNVNQRSSPAPNAAGNSQAGGPAADKAPGGANAAADQPAPPQQADFPLALTAEKLADPNQPLQLDRLAWKFHAGDDPAWASADLDDSGWQNVSPSNLEPVKLPEIGWTGVAWFRMPVEVDAALAGQPLALSMHHLGASEIYVDGKLVESYGRVGATRAEEKTYDPNYAPLGVVFSQPGRHLLAVRYSNTRAINLPTRNEISFRLELSHLNPTLSATLRDTGLKKSLRACLFGIYLAIGLLHLSLFALYPRQRHNLFYSLFLFAGAGSQLNADVMTNAGVDLEAFGMPLTFFTLGFQFVAFTLYLYAALENRIPRYFGLATVFWVVDFGLIFVSLLRLNWLLSFISFAFFASLFFLLCAWHLTVILLIIVRAIYRKVENSWILGLVGFFFVSGKVVLTALALQDTPRNYYLTGELVSILCLIVANAVFLSLQFASTSRNLEAQLVKEVEHQKEKARLAVIEAENERRAKELEEARQLQLSLLPKKLPQLPNLEVAAYMRPATEVGGDYYDFHLSSDGTLTIAVGDATGHGLKAGTVVTAAKTLFRNYADEADIPRIFRESSRVIKEMNLRGLFMAMTMLKIREGRLTVCTAGMPPMLIFRAARGEVEEAGIRALPLGSFSNFNYRQQEFRFSAGDTIVLMSDGFPEMFNEAGEMLGYEKPAELLREVLAAGREEEGGASAQGIIDRFVEAGEAWAGTRPQDDDVTFVVLKIKN